MVTMAVLLILNFVTTLYVKRQNQKIFKCLYTGSFKSRFPILKVIKRSKIRAESLYLYHFIAEIR